MRIGIIVDGQSEFTSIPLILPRLNTPCTVLHPVFADIQPLAPVGQIVRSIKGRVRILSTKSVDRASTEQ